MTEESKTLLSESAKERKDEAEFDAVQAINELKQNSVSKAEYEKVVQEKNKYLKALINGDESFSEQKKQPITDDQVQKLRQSLFSGEQDLSNLEYAKKALELRAALIERDGVDIFVGRGEKLAPTESDYLAAQRVADALESCIEVSDGDSEIFTRELSRITRDVSPQTKINPNIRR